MKCDQCEKDFSVFGELFWNGRYKHADTMFRIIKSKMLVCQSCLDKWGWVTKLISDIKCK